MIERERLLSAARCVRAGGVILYPTATVYGLGGDPTRPEVAERIRRIKRRPPEKPMLLLTDEWDRVTPWIANLTPAHERVMKASPPLPVTILFDTTASELSAVRGTAPAIGIRCTDDAFCRRLIREADVPLISTSANRSGEQPPHRFEGIEEELVEAVDFAVDGGRLLSGEPSTVVALDGGVPRIVRPGPVSEAQLRAIVETNTY